MQIDRFIYRFFALSNSLDWSLFWTCFSSSHKPSHLASNRRFSTYSSPLITHYLIYSALCSLHSPYSLPLSRRLLSPRWHRTLPFCLRAFRCNNGAPPPLSSQSLFVFNFSQEMCKKREKERSRLMAERHDWSIDRSILWNIMRYGSKGDRWDRKVIGNYAGDPQEGARPGDEPSQVREDRGHVSNWLNIWNKFIKFIDSQTCVIFNRKFDSQREIEKRIITIWKSMIQVQSVFPQWRLCAPQSARSLRLHAYLRELSIISHEYALNGYDEYWLQGET